ncbi:MAG: hypothetical protein JWO34_286 [Arthrobacter sp.]|jgi:hypothetical protein|nr:hypothetical protein [Arthrobacter sp.]
MSRSATLQRTKILVPAILLALVGAIVAGLLMSTPRKPPAPLGASASVTGGVARINGVIPTDVDGWTPAAASPELDTPPGEGLHRVRVLLELTALEQAGLSFDPTDYSVSGLGAGKWKALWFSPPPPVAAKGESIDATLVFELPDRAIDLTLELPGGQELSLGAGHHRGGT